MSFGYQKFYDDKFKLRFQAEQMTIQYELLKLTPYRSFNRQSYLDSKLNILVSSKVLKNVNPESEQLKYRLHRFPVTQIASVVSSISSLKPLDPTNFPSQAGSSIKIQ